MMTSTEKVWGLIEHLADADDQELADAFGGIPVPPTLLRMALATAGEQLPKEAAELDAFLENVANFCLALRSGDELPGAEAETVAIEAGDAG